MLPEYDGKMFVVPDSSCMLTKSVVVHVCHNAEAAMSELPRLFTDSSVKPAAGKGSNMSREQGKVPKVIFVGGGFTDAEFENMRSFEVLRTVPWMYPPASVRARGKGPPLPELVVAQARKSLADHGLLPGRTGRIEPSIWEYGHEEVRPWDKSGHKSKL